MLCSNWIFDVSIGENWLNEVMDGKPFSMEERSVAWEMPRSGILEFDFRTSRPCQVYNTRGRYLLPCRFQHHAHRARHWWIEQMLILLKLVDDNSTFAYATHI